MSALTIVEQRGHVLRSRELDWSLSIAQRLALAGCDIWFYAGKLLCPLNLSFVYPRWEIDKAGPIAFLPLLGTVAIAGGLWACRGRTAARAGMFGLGYFVIALLPVLGFVNVFYFRYSFVADHFQYLAGIGVIALAVAAGASALRRRATRAILAGTVLTALGILSWERCGAFHDVEALWRDTINRNPRCWLANNNLGVALIDQGRLQEGIERCEEALRIRPDYPETHFNLGLALAQTGKTRDAIAQYREALRLKPNHANARNNLAWLLATSEDSTAQDHKQAIQLATQASELTAGKQPSYLDTLAAACAAADRFPEAVTYAQKAVELARSGGQAELAGRIESRLELYRAGRAYQESVRVTSPQNP
jgi:tetratricopeptide (TPR) repeat protein